MKVLLTQIKLLPTKKIPAATSCIDLATHGLGRLVIAVVPGKWKGQHIHKSPFGDAELVSRGFRPGHNGKSLVLTCSRMTIPLCGILG